MNNSTSRSQFPSAYKNALVTPVFKKGNKRLPENYRPISYLPILSKVIEPVVKDQLTHHLETLRLLSPRQFGFRRGHSTEQMLHYLLDELCRTMDASQPRYTLLLSIDIRKAFDTVCHETLITKLEKFFSFSSMSISFFQSYLTDRSQTVKIGNGLSDPCLITQGVPQGSILGPILFNMMVNDLLVDNPSVISYADDATLILPSSTVELALSNSVLEFERLEKWYTENGFKLNVAKCACMIVTNRKVPEDLSLTLMNHELKIQDSFPLVGFTLDPRLTLSVQTKNIKSSISSLLYSFKKIRSYLTVSEATQIYKTLIRPKIEYCSTLLLGTTLENERVLESLQNRAVRIICKATFSNSSSFSVSSARLSLNLPTLITRRMESFDRIVANVIGGRRSGALLSLLSGCHTRSRRLRSPCDWVLPAAMTNYGRRRFVFRAVTTLKRRIR